MGLFDRIKAGLFKTAQQLTAPLSNVLPLGPTIPAETLRQLEDQLVLVDMGVPTAKDLLKEVQEKVKAGSGKDPQGLAQILRGAVEAKLRKSYSPFELPKPGVILLTGVNGAGKTTTTGKLAARFATEGRKVLLAAGDTFRAAAEEQLTQWAERAKVGIVRGSHGAAPASVVFDALKSGLSEGADCFLVDTAGRLHNRQNLMEELQKIARVCEKAAPGIHQEKWLVLDGNTGQNAVSQAREFHKEVGLTGLVLTKLDGTAKGGIVVALSDQLGLPVRFLGVGESAEDLIPFDPALFAEALVPYPVLNV
jgi:fused signal recognition particle receptor